MTYIPRLRAALVLLAALAVAGCGRGNGDGRRAPSDADRLHAAVQQVTDVMVYDIFSPPQAARVYAYASVAAYEAMRPGHREYRTLAGQLRGLAPVPAPPPGATVSFPLAGVRAFMTVGRALTFSRARMDSARAAMDDAYRARVPAAVFDSSVAYGDRVAEHVLAWAGRDQYLQSRGAPKFAVTNTPGRWVPTPPGYFDAVEPHWGELRPFVLDSADQFRPPPPPPFDTTRGSPFFRELQEVYDVTRRLTDEQRAIAGFWDCNPYTMHVQGHTMYATKKISPGGHWVGIVAIASRKAGADAMRSAEAYARTAVALDDAFIAGWKEKYRSSLVRPETVINAHLDEAWQPLLQTPPFPEYLSGHSVISTAAAAVLTDQFGANFRFVDSTEMTYGLPPRAFPSFEAAAAEAAISRLYGGIHYRQAIDEGVVLGRKVGALVVARVETRAPPAVAARTP